MLLTNSALLLAGESGSGKTSLIATYADYIYEKYGKFTRYYSADPGGYGDKIQARIEAGIIQVFRMRTRDPDGNLGLVFETLERATQGYWPREIDPASGIVQPGVEMIAPRIYWYEMICANGHLAKRAQTRAGLTQVGCEKCKVVTSVENCGEVRHVSEPQGGMDLVGGLAFDSLTSMCTWCTTDLAVRMSKNMLGGEPTAIKTINSGSLNIGGSNRSGVGFIQNRIDGWIQNSTSNPELVVPPLFTALELKTTDDNNMPFYGPRVAGRAKTDEIPTMFGNCLGTAIVKTESGNEWRLYLQQYRGTDGVPHLCKNRAAPGSLPEYLSDPAGEEFTKFNVGYFLGLLEGVLGKESEKVKEKFKGAPGLGSGKITLSNVQPVAMQQKNLNVAVPVAKAAIPQVGIPAIPMAVPAVKKV